MRLNSVLVAGLNEAEVSFAEAPLYVIDFDAELNHVRATLML